jgi:hypothetical protein
VNASIGSACGYDFYRVIRDETERGFDAGLNASRMRLRLPTGEAATVVFESKGYARHGRALRALRVDG